MALTALLNLISANATQQGSSDRITGTEMREILNTLVGTIQSDIAYSSAIPFDKLISKMAPLSVNGPVTFTKNTTGAIPGFGTILRVTGDGVNTPDLTAFKKASLSGSYVATAGTVNVFMFVYDGIDYWYTVFQEAGTSSGSTQLSAPVLSITSGTATPVVLDWNDVTNATGYAVERATNSGFTANLITLATPSASTYSDASAQAGTTYYYRVYATSSSLPTSAASNVVSVTTAASGNITPPAPTAGVVDDTANTFSYTLASGYTLADHEMSLDGGSTWAAATNPVSVGNVAKAIGQVQVRVKAATGRNASAVLSNASAFNVDAGSGGAALSYTGTNIQEASGVWSTATPNSDFGNIGIESRKLAAGQSGRIYTHVVDESNCNLIFGFNNTGTVGGWSTVNGIHAGFYLQGSGLIEVENHALSDTVGALTLPLYVGVHRDGSTGAIKLQTSPDGATWTDRATLGITTTGDLWPAFDLYGSATTGKLNQPKGENIA